MTTKECSVKNIQKACNTLMEARQLIWALNSQLKDLGLDALRVQGIAADEDLRELSNELAFKAVKTQLPKQDADKFWDEHRHA